MTDAHCPSVHQDEYDLTTRERELLMTDILSYYADLTANESMSDEEWDERIEDVRALEGDDSDLVFLWNEQVGEWLLSRDDVIVRYEDEYGVAPEGDEIVNSELCDLLHPEKNREYGYVIGASNVYLSDDRDAVKEEYQEKYAA